MERNNPPRPCQCAPCVRDRRRALRDGKGGFRPLQRTRACQNRPPRDPTSYPPPDDDDDDGGIEDTGPGVVAVDDAKRLWRWVVARLAGHGQRRRHGRRPEPAPGRDRSRPNPVPPPVPPADSDPGVVIREGGG